MKVSRSPAQRCRCRSALSRRVEVDQVARWVESFSSVCVWLLLTPASSKWLGWDIYIGHQLGVTTTSCHPLSAQSIGLTSEGSSVQPVTRSAEVAIGLLTPTAADRTATSHSRPALAVVLRLLLLTSLHRRLIPTHRRFNLCWRLGSWLVTWSLDNGMVNAHIDAPCCTVGLTDAKFLYFLPKCTVQCTYDWASVYPVFGRRFNWYCVFCIHLSNLSRLSFGHLKYILFAFSLWFDVSIANWTHWIISMRPKSPTNLSS